jgi:hypothetical protein
MEKERSVSGRGVLMLAYMRKKVTDGPLAPIGTNRDWMKGETAQGVIPIEVAPADSELHKCTVRQGVRYVRIQGYVEALRHIPHRAEEFFCEGEHPSL